MTNTDPIEPQASDPLDSKLDEILLKLMNDTMTGVAHLQFDDGSTVYDEAKASLKTLMSQERKDSYVKGWNDGIVSDASMKTREREKLLDELEGRLDTLWAEPALGDLLRSFIASKRTKEALFIDYQLRKEFNKENSHGTE